MRNTAYNGSKQLKKYSIMFWGEDTFPPNSEQLRKLCPSMM
jgi:hypothetical protein